MPERFSKIERYYRDQYEALKNRTIFNQAFLLAQFIWELEVNDIEPEVIDRIEIELLERLPANVVARYKEHVKADVVDGCRKLRLRDMRKESD